MVIHHIFWARSQTMQRIASLFGMLQWSSLGNISLCGWISWLHHCSCSTSETFLQDFFSNFDAKLKNLEVMFPRQIVSCELIIVCAMLKELKYLLHIHSTHHWGYNCIYWTALYIIITYYYHYYYLYLQLVLLIVMSVRIYWLVKTVMLEQLTILVKDPNAKVCKDGVVVYCISKRLVRTSIVSQSKTLFQWK